MTREIQDVRYFVTSTPSHLDVTGAAPPSVDDFVGSPRLDAAPPPTSSSAVPIDIQLVRELNQWQGSVRTAVLEYLWLRSVLEAGDKFRKRVDLQSPDVSDIRDDLDAMFAAFYASPRADRDSPAVVSAALTRMRELLDAPEGPYLNEHADFAAFRTQIRSELARARADVQREVYQLEQQARDAVERLGTVVDVIFRSAREAQQRAEEEHQQEYARALGQGVTKPSIPVHALSRETTNTEFKASVFLAATRPSTSRGGVP